MYHQWNVASLGAIAWLCGWWLLGWTAPASAQDNDGWPTIFHETTEVNVVNVDVVVTDGQGRPITGLKREDFLLLSDGEEVEVSNFYAVEDGRVRALESVPGPTQEPASPATGTAPAPEERQLNLLVYVDDANISTTHRSKVFAHLRKFLLDSWREEMRVMLVSSEPSLVVRQRLTQVPHDVFVALDELEHTSTQISRFDVDRRNLMRAIAQVNAEEGSGLFSTKSGIGTLSGATTTGADPNQLGDTVIDQGMLTDRAVAEASSILPQIHAHAQERFEHVLATISTLQTITNAVASLPGRKALVYVSDGLALRSGEELFEAFDRRFHAMPGMANRISPQSEAARYDASRELKELVAHANSSRVTFYALDASPPERLESGSAESASSSFGNFGSFADSMAATIERNDQDSLVFMAAETGGRAGLTSTLFESLFAGIFTDFDNYYSLGYLASGFDDRKLRSMEVRLRQPQDRKWKLRYRSSFRDKTTDERMSEQTLSALMMDIAHNPLAISLAAQEPSPQEDGHFLVPVAVQIPLANIVLLPGESEHQGRVSFYVAVQDGKGRTSQVVKNVCPIRIPNSEILVALGQQASCGVRLLMRRGEQTVAVSVLDELASTESTVELNLTVGAGKG